MTMTTQTPTAAGLAHVHESSHTRTAINSDADGRKTLTVSTSVLSMNWRAGELRLTHRFSSVPVRPMGRGMRSRL
ncbi:MULTISPECIES: hypothetical protein [unclassified Polaromonas]|uniref:hypothetical protein n=1 Tax=unclassified Polaromonas TaxID=2638319 RepID=UPI000BD7E84F|nr:MULTISPECIES: hypothetical protein [unclassified Polaromonas]OYZ79718.1 MAG: hypothetical protein B7Y09_09355 [Polaromonas sp. 24-63-21]HQS38952.1 hypothetical protein [Polaromonas sp.]